MKRRNKIIGGIAAVALLCGLYFLNIPYRYLDVVLMAHLGDGPAQYKLGKIYAAPSDVTVCIKTDLKTALKWYEKAAAQGYVDAEYEIGQVYSVGWLYSKFFGSQADTRQTLAWMTKAAEKGHLEAQAYLSKPFQGEADKTKTYMWLLVLQKNRPSIDSDRYRKGEAQERERLKRYLKLTKTEINKAEELANKIPKLKPPLKIDMRDINVCDTGSICCWEKSECLFK